MAIINLYTKKPEAEEFNLQKINYDGSVIGWMIENIKDGQNFKVYDGEISKSNEISRKPELMELTDNVSVFILPGDAVTAIYLVVSVLAVALLTKKIKPLANINRQQQSPNNSFSERGNKARPNQRIVDICGQVRSVPDILQQEYSYYDNNTEQRIGYYCIARNRVLPENIKEADTLFKDIEGYSAGVYFPYLSPNNSEPTSQIGEIINKPVVGVYQSPDAQNQSLKAPNSNVIELQPEIEIESTGIIRNTTGENNYAEYFQAGDKVNTIDFYGYFPAPIPGDPENTELEEFSLSQYTVLSVTNNQIQINVSEDPKWSELKPSTQALPTNTNPKITQIEAAIVGPFKITSAKISALLVNVFAPNGMYKENAQTRLVTTVNFNLYYQFLDDSGNPIGSQITVSGAISGNDQDEKGVTVGGVDGIDLGTATYVEWSLERITPIDYNFDGNIVDEIKLVSVYGLVDINKADFGNVTTIQTKRARLSQATAIKSPELNLEVTELLQRYNGTGFDAVYSANTQAMQSLIRMALDPYIGRRKESEIDLDGFLSIQAEVTDYFNSAESASFNYSFDSTQISAQETFLTIGAAVFTTLWREGVLLKGWFEKPQTVPAMVFTHRSKQAGSEIWKRDRNSAQKKDSIEFTYTDSKTYQQEVLYFPSDRSGKNPLRVEMPGVKGLSLATWQMMRRYNKLLYQEISVDFTSTSEGRFVKPKRMISVVKGPRIFTYDGEIVSQNGLELTLSQAVQFTENDDHYLILKQRNGSTESVMVAETPNPRVINLLQLPSEDIYTGNSELRTEFSFGNEARLSGQMIIPEEISPVDRQYVNIKGVNYSDLYYKDDPTQPIIGAFSDGFDDGFS